MWRVAPGLIGSMQTFSFESIVAKGHYLTFNNEDQLLVVKDDETIAMRLRATWNQIVGLSGSGGFSLESLADSNYVIDYDEESVFESQ